MEKRVFNEKQVVGKMIVGVLYIINELRLSIYRFLVLGTEKIRQ